jgi:hypothetical protein
VHNMIKDAKRLHEIIKHSTNTNDLWQPINGHRMGASNMYKWKKDKEALKLKLFLEDIVRYYR